MTTVRYTAFIARTQDGHRSAEVLIPPTPWNPVLSAYGRSREELVSQLRRGLRYQLRTAGWLPDPFRWREPAILPVAVDLRPGWRQNERYYSGDRVVRLEVSCVHGELEDGEGRYAFFPRLRTGFFYFEPEQLKETIKTEVQKHFFEAPIEAIAGFLPYSEEGLEAISVTVPRARIRSTRPPEVGVLERVGERLDRRVLKKKGGAAYEREDEVAAVSAALEEGVAGLLILGESGVGKTCIVYEALKRLLRGEKAGEAEAPTLYESSGGRIIAGMRYLGEWEQRAREVCEALAQSNAVLYAADLVAFLTAGRVHEDDRGLDAIVRPYLERNEIKLILESSPRGLEAAEQLAPGFTKLFKIVQVEEVSRAQSLSILDRVLTERLPGRPEVPREVSAVIDDLVRRFVPAGHFPGKAVPLARELAPRKSEDPMPSPADVIDAFSVRTGIPGIFLDDNVPLAPKEVADFFASRLVGQDEARRAAVSLVAVLKSGLNDPRRPIASLLLSGPTGVGKTELAKCLAEFFFSGRERLIRLDMSEYGLPGSVSRLVGDLRSGPGELTKKIRDQPFSVVLFDEVEKADPAVFDILMGLFDEGRLTDPFGRTADFRSAMIVMTSNLGALKGEALGFHDDAAAAVASRTLGAITEFFRPEFVNRIDRIVGFTSLNYGQCLAIAGRELEKLKGREGFERRGLKLEFAEGVAERIAREGFDPDYGARPLKRALERLVTTPLAARLAADAALRGGVLRLSFDEAGALAIDGP